MILLFYFIVKHNSFVEEGRIESSQGRICNVHANSTNYFPLSQDGRSDHSPSFQTIFFGIVSILYIISSLVNVLMEHETDVEMVKIANNIFHDFCTRVHHFGHHFSQKI